MQSPNLECNLLKSNDAIESNRIESNRMQVADDPLDGSGFIEASAAISSEHLALPAILLARYGGAPSLDRSSIKQSPLSFFLFGLDWIGLDWIGLDWIGLDWIGLDWIGLDWIGLDWIGLGDIGASVMPSDLVTFEREHELLAHEVKSNPSAKEQTITSQGLVRTAATMYLSTLDTAHVTGVSPRVVDLAVDLYAACHP